jgi:hypothetical protein
MYISALAAELATTPLNPQHMKEVFDYCFDHPNHELSKKVAWDELSQRDGIERGLAGMRELVRQEVAAGEFNFFCKLRSKYMTYYELGVTDQRLTEGDLYWYLKI